MSRVVSRSVASPLDPPWLQCHGSTILVDAGGELLCSWFAGTAEGALDNVIWLARGTRDEAGWTFGEPEAMSQVPDAHWNPVLGRAPGGGISLFYKRGLPISRWSTWVRRSEDGRQWSPAVELVPGDVGGRGPVKNPPIVGPDGTWLAPASVESASLDSAESPGRPAVWDSFVDLSRDNGATWERSALVPVDHDRFHGAGIIQPTLWVGRGGDIVALMRSTAGSAWRSHSSDGGRTWAPAVPTTLPNNNSGLCALARPDGTVVCAHNTSGISWGPRNTLALSASTDDGLTWERLGVIEELEESGQAFDGQDAGVVTTGRGELSYPTLIADPDHADRLLVSYTRERQAIVVAEVES
jgi:predicted neuraminidase